MYNSNQDYQPHSRSTYRLIPLAQKQFSTKPWRELPYCSIFQPALVSLSDPRVHNPCPVPWSHDGRSTSLNTIRHNSGRRCGCCGRRRGGGGRRSSGVWVIAASDEVKVDAAPGRLQPSPVVPAEIISHTARQLIPSECRAVGLAHHRHLLDAAALRGSVDAAIRKRGRSKACKRISEGQRIVVGGSCPTEQIGAG